jgi:hypothetical protein
VASIAILIEAAGVFVSKLSQRHVSERVEEEDQVVRPCRLKAQSVKFDHCCLVAVLQDWIWR